MGIPARCNFGSYACNPLFFVIAAPHFVISTFLGFCVYPNLRYLVFLSVILLLAVEPTLLDPHSFAYFVSIDFLNLGSAILNHLTPSAGSRIWFLTPRLSVRVQRLPCRF